MPHGKPANVPCVQLDAQGRCQLFNDPHRPLVCRQLQPALDMCGDSDLQALRILSELEAITA